MVGDFSERCDCRARVGIAARPLGDGDDGGKPTNEIHIRTGDRFQEPAGFGGEGFEVLPRALGMQRIECERGLARAADSGDHGQLMTRNGQFHVLQVVGTGTFDVDGGAQGRG